MEIIGNEQTVSIINEMLAFGIIPKDKPFEITNNLLDLYYIRYCEKYPEKSTKHKRKEVRYFKKLAGLTLMKLSLSRVKTKEKKVKEKPVLKSGILYLISNPIFPNLYKIGITQDLNARLSSYQTYDPHRRYKVEHYKFVDNMREEEKNILKKYRIDISVGEWIDNKKVKEMFTEFV